MTAVVRKEVIYSAGCFDESPAMYGIEDWDMWLRIGEHHKFRAVCMPVAVYRRPASHTGQWSSNIQMQFARVAQAYKNKWLVLPRAKKLLAEGKIDRSDLLGKVADRILYDMATGPPGLKKKFSKTMTALKCSPRKIRDPNLYKTLLLMFIRKELNGSVSNGE